MKKITLAITASIFLLSGCSNTTPTVQKHQTQQAPLTDKEKMIRSVNSLPQWVVNPTSKDGITAVGMAGYSKYGLRVMKPEAEMDARAKLAGQIQTIISRSQKSAMRLSQVADVDAMDSAFTQSTKEVIKKIPLSGAVIVNQKMVESGDYYVQMVIKKQAVAQELDASKDIYKKKLQKAKLTRASVEDGMKVLDKMIDNLDKDVK